VIATRRARAEQRMQDDLTRLVGLDGLEVKGVVEVGARLDLEVESVARAGVCRAVGARRSTSRIVRWCGCATCRLPGV
jgi:hypothetical protein